MCRLVFLTRSGLSLQVERYRSYRTEQQVYLTSFQRSASTFTSCINVQPCPHTLIDLFLCGQPGSLSLSRQRSRGFNNGYSGNSMLQSRKRRRCQ